MSDKKSQELQATGMVEWSVFSELVAMDEDEEGFCKSLFQTFVDQVIDTFGEIDENLRGKNLERLSALGHYLKGSAAALGLTQISAQCERIQNYGHRNNFDNFDVAQSPAFIGGIGTSDSGGSGRDKSSSNAILGSSTNDTPNDNNDPPSTNDTNIKQSTTSIPDESSDDFWIALIQDALEKARDGFIKSKAALSKYFDDEF